MLMMKLNVEKQVHLIWKDQSSDAILVFTLIGLRVLRGLSGFKYKKSCFLKRKCQIHQ